METTLQRIKKFIDYKEISVRRFEEYIGMSNGSFASQLKNNKTIGVDKLENILFIYPEINAEWLLTGEGSMLREPGTNCTVSQPAPPVLSPSQSTDSQTKDSDNNAPVQEKSDITDKFSVNDLVKAITNLSEAAVINAEANNRQSKNIERMLDMLSGDSGTYQKKAVIGGYTGICNTA